MRALLVVLCGLALALAACAGEPGADRPERGARLLLDFTPNAVHAGIFSAVARGYDDAEGVSLRVRAPSTSTDAVRLLLSGRAELAVLDIHDLALARARGRDVVGVMALVQRPLAAVLAAPGVRSPRDLEGRRVGVTGLPSDDAVLRSIVAGSGGDPGRVRTTTIGFNAVAALLSGRVAGATAFWSVEGTALRARRPGSREFRVDAFGAPPYPELVLATARTTLTDDPAIVRAAVRALRRGYDLTLNDPPSSAQDLIDRNRGLEPGVVRAQLDALSGAFLGAQERFGVLDPAVLRAWARWEARFGIVRRPPDVERAFAPDVSVAP